MRSINGFNALLAICSLFVLCGQGVCDVVINEIELSAPDNEIVWVELYNTGEGPVDLTGWEVHFRDGAWKGIVALQGSIDPKGFRVAEGEDSWVTTGNGTIHLYNSLGEEVDRVAPQRDETHTYFTYGRIPDGKKTGNASDFALLRSSRGMSNDKE